MTVIDSSTTEIDKVCNMMSEVACCDSSLRPKAEPRNWRLNRGKRLNILSLYSLVDASRASSARPVLFSLNRQQLSAAFDLRYLP